MRAAACGQARRGPNARCARAARARSRAPRSDARRGPGAGRAHRRATALAAPPTASASGLAGRVAFCAAASCAAVGSPSTTTRLLRRPLAQPGGAPRPRGDVVLVTPAISAIPVCGSTGVPLEAPLDVQLAAQGGLIDHPGGLGFVIQRLAVDRHQLAVGAGLAVGDDDVGVQVRVPAPRRFVLIGDRHQPGQPLQVLLPGDRVVHPGVAGVLVQILHRLGDGRGVRVGDHLLRRRHRSAPGSATHSWARRTSDRNRAPRSSPNARPHAPFGATPSSSQRATTSVSATPPAAPRRPEPAQPGHRTRCRRRTARSGCGCRARSSTPPTHHRPPGASSRRLSAPRCAVSL